MILRRLSCHLLGNNAFQMAANLNPGRGNGSVVFGSTPFVCVVYAEVPESFAWVCDESGTSFVPLIYRCIMMFFILPCPHAHPVCLPLVNFHHALGVFCGVRSLLCKACTCCMLGNVSTLIFSSLESLYHHISVNFLLCYSTIREC